MTELFAAASQVVLHEIRQAAINNERCPSNAELAAACKRQGFEYPDRARPAYLARNGFFKVELYMRGYRVIEIDGLRTKACPWPGGPLRVFPSVRETEE